MDDATIINLFWARDEAAIPAAQDKYGAYCRAIALGILADARDADECVNDALLRLWRAIPPERPRSLRAFLGRITRNLAINALRDASRQKRGGGAAALAARMGWTKSKTASLLMRLRALLREALISEDITL